MYVDPGSGSYLLQVMVAAVLGVSYGLRSRLKALALFFRRGGRRRDGGTHDAP